MSNMKVRTEVFDGIEFEIPTWDPTPVEWNDHGSWVKDPTVEERVRSGILAAIPNHAELLAEAYAAQKVGPDEKWCKTYWGSHGCDRPQDHPGLCVCSIRTDDGEKVCCSAGLKYGDADTLILWWNGDDEPSVHHWTWFT